MNDTQRLHQAAEMARTIMLRLCSEKGVLEQIASGEWDGGLTERGAVDDCYGPALRYTGECSLR